MVSYLQTIRYGRLVEVEPTIKGLIMVKVDAGSELLVGVLSADNIKAELGQSVEVRFDSKGNLFNVKGVAR